MSKDMSKVAVLCGSLRKASTNAGILRAIVETKDPAFQFQWVDISSFPLFNEDSGIPSSVKKAREIVGHCDAIIFAIPEYNSSLAGSFKNAYDWLAIEDDKKFSPLTHKVGAMVTSGTYGGSMAQDHFREISGHQKMKIMKPSRDATIQIKRFTGQYFDMKGNLIDKQVREKRIPKFLHEFGKFIKSESKH